MITLTDIDNYAHDYQQSSVDLKTYIGLFDDAEISALMDKDYPILTSDLLPSVISPTRKVVELRLQFQIITRCQEATINYRDEMNQTLFMMNDFILWIRNQITGYAVVSNDVNITPLSNYSTDRAVGWRADITFAIPNTANPCLTPKT